MPYRDKEKQKAYQQGWEKQKKRKLTKPFTHGTLNGYTNYKCKCEACVKAHSEYNSKWRRSKKAVLTTE